MDFDNHLPRFLTEVQTTVVEKTLNLLKCNKWPLVTQEEPNKEQAMDLHPDIHNTEAHQDKEVLLHVAGPLAEPLDILLLLPTPSPGPDKHRFGSGSLE